MENILQQVSVLNTSIMYGYAFLGAIALLLSVTGLYTLVSLNIIRRMKEIGIRKIVGASVAGITRVVNTEFVVILAIASIMGSWAGFNWCNTIMSTIWKYHQGVKVLTIVIAVGLLFTVSFLAISYKIFSIATMNPVKTLRDEYVPSLKLRVLIPYSIATGKDDRFSFGNDNGMFMLSHVTAFVTD